jgi:hypothetical protein
MRATSRCLVPVVTLWSPSGPRQARKAAELLQRYTALRPVKCDPGRERGGGVFAWWPLKLVPRLDSVALQCPVSGAILHWLSLEQSEQRAESDQKSNGFSMLSMVEQGRRRRLDQPQPFQLLALQEMSSLSSAIGRVTEMISLRSRKLSFAVAYGAHKLWGRRMTISDLVGSPSPIDERWVSVDDGERTRNGKVGEHTFGSKGSDDPLLFTSNGAWKEIAIPSFNSSLLGQLRGLSWTSPVIGVYCCSTSPLGIRPLPLALEDRRIPPPSLVFHQSEPAQDVADVSSHEQPPTRTPIGCTGQLGQGQLLLQHPMWSGLDIRFSSLSRHPLMFAEAQESLLAGSLDELQSPDVLCHGKDVGRQPSARAGVVTVRKSIQDRENASTSLSLDNLNENETDAGKDCWVEFRANLRHPTGFFEKRATKSTAKVPDIPYE